MPPVTICIIVIGVLLLMGRKCERCPNCSGKLYLKKVDLEFKCPHCGIELEIEDNEQMSYQEQEDITEKDGYIMIGPGLCPGCKDIIQFLPNNYGYSYDTEGNLISMFCRVECPCGWRGYHVIYRPFSRKSRHFVEHEKRNVMLFNYDGLIELMSLPIDWECPVCKNFFEQNTDKTIENDIVFEVKCNVCGFEGSIVHDSYRWMFCKKGDSECKSDI